MRKISQALLSIFITVNLFATFKLITKDFKWLIHTTKHFEIFYYDAGREILPTAAEMLENSYSTLSQELKHEIPQKIPFFLYISHNDFEQTNISDVGEGTGGFAEALKNRFVIPHTGSLTWLEHVINHELTHIFQFSILYGYGFLKSFKIILKSIFYPLWLLEGMAEYFGARYDYIEREVYMRDIVYNNLFIPISQLHSFNHLKPNQVYLAYKLSEAFIDFLNDEYGKETIEKILKGYVGAFEPNILLKRNIGLTLDKLEEKFKEYLQDKYTIQIKTKKEPNYYGKQITKKTEFPYSNTDPTISPNEKYIAFISNINGMNEVFLYDIEKNKLKKIITKNILDKIDHISTSGRALKFSKDSNSIIFVGEKKQKDYIFIYNIKTKKINRISPQKLEIIRTPDLYNGKIVFSAMSGSQTDIYLYDLETKKLQNLTNDFYDDTSPEFSHDGKKIVFSKELPTKNSRKKYEYDIFIYDIEKSTSQKITDLQGDETNPTFKDDTTVLFLSDWDTFPNIYSLDLKTKELKKMTDLITGVSEFAISKNHLVFSSLWKNSYHIYLSDLKKLQQIPTPPVNTETTTLEEPKIKPEDKKYSWKYSTDIFIPIMFYSTEDGLATLLLWQGSDYPGNNTFSISLQYFQKWRYLDYQALYSYKRFIPYLTVILMGRARGRSEEHSQLTNFSFPLDRYNEINFSIGNIVSVININILSTSFIRNTLSGEYIEPLSGEYISTSIELASDFWGGDYIYQNFFLIAAKYNQIGVSKTFVYKILSLNSFGKDARSFSLSDKIGDIEMVRGLKSDIPTGKNILTCNFEYRFPIVYDINYHMWYIIPDILIKSFYGYMFCDTGTNFFKVRKTIGFGTRLHFFIFQMFPLNLNLYLAYDIDEKKTFLSTLFFAYFVF